MFTGSGPAMMSTFAVSPGLYDFWSGMIWMLSRAPPDQYQSRSGTQIKAVSSRVRFSAVVAVTCARIEPPLLIGTLISAWPFASVWPSVENNCSPRRSR